MRTDQLERAKTSQKCPEELASHAVRDKLSYQESPLSDVLSLLHAVECASGFQVLGAVTYSGAGFSDPLFVSYICPVGNLSHTFL